MPVLARTPKTQSGFSRGVFGQVQGARGSFAGTETQRLVCRKNDGRTFKELLRKL